MIFDDQNIKGMAHHSFRIRKTQKATMKKMAMFKRQGTLHQKKSRVINYSVETNKKKSLILSKGNSLNLSFKDLNVIKQMKNDKKKIIKGNRSIHSFSASSEWIKEVKPQNTTFGRASNLYAKFHFADVKVRFSQSIVEKTSEYDVCVQKHQFAKASESTQVQKFEDESLRL